MLTVINGPMYAGKSSALISILEANIIAGRHTLAFKPSNDTRYSINAIKTHSGTGFSAMNVDKDGPEDILLCLSKYDLEQQYVDVVGIDEAQFFNATSLIDVVDTLVYKDRRDVIISGLSQDSYGKPFGAMPYLLATADEIIHLKAVCNKTRQLNSATRTYRKSKGNTDQVAVGGTEMYEARSFKAWLLDN